jgi:hypothetical protein
MASVVQVKHIKGDRSDADLVKSLLEGKGFQVVYGINGELDERTLEHICRREEVVFHALQIPGWRLVYFSRARGC